VRRWTFVFKTPGSHSSKFGRVYEVIKIFGNGRTFIVSRFNARYVSHHDVAAHSIDPRWLGTPMGWIDNESTLDAFRGDLW
jgi:hypothetical protein